MDSQRDMRTAYRQMLSDLKPNVAMTLGWGQSISEMTINRKIDHFLNCVQRKALGRNWAKVPRAARLQALGFAEHHYSNTHTHLAITAPDPVRLVLAGSKPQWRKIRPGAHWYYIYLDTPEIYASYVTKDYLRNADHSQPYIYG